MKGFLITGTDTEVGKTIVSLGISLALKDMGTKCSYMKPVESGIKSGNEGDAYLVKNMMKLKENINKIRPFRLSNPITPAIAFNIENKRLNMKTIIDNYLLFSKKNDIVLIEGAGGIMSPIADNIFISDIAKLLNTPIIIVIANKLGAINHSLLTVHYALSIKLNIKCCILNSITYKKDTAQDTNYSEILRNINRITKEKKINNIPLFQTPFVKDIENKESYKNSFTDVAKHLKSNKY